MSEYAGIETVTTPYEPPLREMVVDCASHLVLTDEPFSPVAAHARREGNAAQEAETLAARRREQALAALRRAAHGPERALTTKDLADLLRAVEGL